MSADQQARTPTNSGRWVTRIRYHNEATGESVILEHPAWFRDASMVPPPIISYFASDLGQFDFVYQGAEE